MKTLFTDGRVAADGIDSQGVYEKGEGSHRGEAGNSHEAGLLRRGGLAHLRNRLRAVRGLNRLK